MPRQIAVIDYGMGNLRSVAKALEHVVEAGDRVVVTDDHEQILAADHVVFPGQGAARDCMKALADHHVNKAVTEAARNKPFLGICMGLQVLMDSSDENGGTRLLGLFSGRVKRFPGDARDQLLHDTGESVFRTATLPAHPAGSSLSSWPSPLSVRM